MDAWMWVLIAVLVVAAIAAVAWVMTERRRTEQLRDRFGSEYDRTVAETGDRRAGEAELRDRVERRESFDLRPLSAAAANRYAEDWRTIQAKFVDAPGSALAQADRLITSLMRERGYPVEDFDQRTADLSVDHAVVLDDYRTAHAISLANDERRASTEDLRQGMVHYRSLFERMLVTDTDTGPTADVGIRS
jgi:hypothetical protein